MQTETTQLIVTMDIEAQMKQGLLARLESEALLVANYPLTEDSARKSLLPVMPWFKKYKMRLKNLSKNTFCSGKLSKFACHGHVPATGSGW